MWRLITFLTAILSLVGFIYLFNKYRQSLEDDPFYMYGDSLYRPDSQNPSSDQPAPSTSGEAIDDSEDISSMVH